MNFRQYVNLMNEFLKEHPEAGDLTAIYAADDEGNGYSEIVYGPSKGCYGDNISMFSDFVIEDDFDEYDGELEVNAVCVN